MNVRAPMPDSERHRPRKRNREGDETVRLQRQCSTRSRRRDSISPEPSCFVFLQRNHDDSREKRPRDDGPTSNPRFRERGEEQEDD
eukprot:scaffold4372_cov397-Prasinococcus_capsulatus_cf.AAC.4